MARISIRETLGYSVGSYFNHFITLTGAGCILGMLAWGMKWIPNVMALQFQWAAEQPVIGIEQIPPFMANLFDGLAIQWRATVVSTTLQGSFLIVCLGALLGFLYYWTYFGYVKMLLDLDAEGKSVSLTTLYKADRHFLRIVVGMALYIISLIIFAASVGFACFILAKIHSFLAGVGAFVGLIMILHGTMRVFLFHFFILDKGLKAIDALKESWDITQGQTFKMLSLFVFFMFFALAGTFLVALVSRLIFSLFISSLITTVFLTASIGAIGNLCLVKVYRTLSR